MVPPPIRVRLPEGACEAPGRKQKSGLDWLRWQRPQQAPSSPENSLDDDLVCLSPLSQFFCNVECPPDIYANMTLQGHCSLEELVPRMQHMADLHDRFRRRLVRRLGVWKGEVLEDFDVRTLMREVTLDGPDAQQAYHDYMGRLMSDEPLSMDNGLPPWDVICIHYACEPRRTDVLMRASHIIGDGQLFMKLIKQIMDPQDAKAEADFEASILRAPAGTPGVAPAPRGARPNASSSSGSLSSAGGASSGGGSGPAAVGGGGGLRRAGGPSSCGSDSGDSLGSSEQLAETCSIGSNSSGGVSEQALQTATAQLQQQQQPQQAAQQHSKHARRRANFFKLLWAVVVWCWNQYTSLIFNGLMLLWRSDPVTLLKAAPEECAGPRRWGSATVPLHEFQRVARALGHSLNTLAVACLAGGVRRYLLAHGATPAARLRLCGMVDTRSMPGLLTGASGNSSNNFSFIGVPLFTGECSPLARLARVGWALSWIRHSLAVPIAIRMPRLIQFVFRDPAWSSWAILRALPCKTSIGFSNMRGPTGSWALAGYPVTRIHNGVQPMAFGSFISMFSYADGLTFTHTCYETKTRTPEVLLACMLDEYAALRKAATLLRDSEPGTPGPKIKAA